MFGIILFWITAYVLGRAVVTLVEKEMPVLVRILASLILGTALTTLALFFLGFVLPFTAINITALLVLLFIVSVFFLFKKRVALFWEFKKTIGLWFTLSKKAKLISLLIVCLIVWLFGRELYYTTSGQLIAGDRLTWGDGPVHMTMAASFAYGQNFPPQHPTFAGTPLIYPFFADFLSGVFLALGARLPMAFAVPGVVLTLAFCGMFVVFAGHLFSESKLHKELKLLKSLVFLPLILSLFWGGLGFVYWFSEAFVDEAHLFNTLTFPPREYSFWGDKGLWFFTFLFSEILPQRAFLFGLPLFFLVLWLLMRGFEKNQPRLLILSGVIAGSMPFFHTHSFLSLWLLTPVLWGCWFISALRSKTQSLRVIKNSLWYFVPFITLTLIQLPLFLGGNRSIAFEFGWLKGKENFFWFWFKNTGVFLPLFFLGLWKGAFSKTVRALGLSSLVLFIAPNLFRFAPWAYDNLKIFTYWYLISSVFVAVGLFWMYQRNRLGKIIAVGLYVSLILTGVVEVGRLFNTQRTQVGLWPQEDQVFANQVKATTPAHAVFLTAAIHDHPVAALAGREIVIGYPGNAWSWGIPGWDTREQDVHRMFQGGDASVVLWKKYKIDYIIIGERERWFEKNLNEKFIAEYAQLVLVHGKTKVYKLK